MDLASKYLKRPLRRRRYRRLENDATNSDKKKLKITRLGGGINSPPRRRLWRIRAIPKLRFRFLSPTKLLEKLRHTYVDMMVRWAGNQSATAAVGKRILDDRQLRMVSSNFEEVDTRLVLEIYKRMASTRELTAF